MISSIGLHFTAKRGTLTQVNKVARPGWEGGGAAGLGREGGEVARLGQEGGGGGRTWAGKGGGQPDWASSSSTFPVHLPVLEACSAGLLELVTIDGDGGVYCGGEKR